MMSRFNSFRLYQVINYKYMGLGNSLRLIILISSALCNSQNLI